MRVVVTAVLVLFCHLLVAQPSSSEISLQQEMVLTKLAAEGVMAAQTELARRSVQRYRDNPNNINALTDLKQQLYAAARLGDKAAIYHLGHGLLIESNNSSEARLAGLSIIATSAILGYRKAQVDFRFMPDVVTWPESEFVLAFNRAVDNLKRGKFIDCIRIAVGCDETEDIKLLQSWLPKEILSSLRDYQNHDSSSLKIMLASKSLNFDGFGQRRKINFNTRQIEANKRQLVRQNLKTKLNPTAADWNQQTYNDRYNNRSQSAAHYLSDIQSSLLTRYQEPVEALLRKINRYRAPDSAVLFKTVQGSLAEPL